MLFDKMTPPEAKDCCPIGTATTQKRSQSSRFVDEIFANAGEVKRKEKRFTIIQLSQKIQLGVFGTCFNEQSNQNSISTSLRKIH